MSEPFIGEIRLSSFTFAPKGWAFCWGQTISITQNSALFSLLGTTYGGDGKTTFALPNMCGRVPIHTGPGFNLGNTGGEEFHTLTASELPSHAHNGVAIDAEGTSADPSNRIPARSGDTATFAPGTSLASDSLLSESVGGAQAHENRQPYLCLNFIIALQGIFPSQS